MPQTPHIERHFTTTETVRDVVIGMSDGLTVPFAPAAGLSGAVASTMMRFELGLEKPDPRRALASAFTIGGAYVAGGFTLAPYMALAWPPVALMVSVVVTIVAPALFGWVRAHFTETAPLRGAFQTMLIGGAAAAAAFAIARGIS